MLFDVHTAAAVEVIVSGIEWALATLVPANVDVTVETHTVSDDTSSTLHESNSTLSNCDASEWIHCAHMHVVDMTLAHWQAATCAECKLPLGHDTSTFTNALFAYSCSVCTQTADSSCIPVVWHAHCIPWNANLAMHTLTCKTCGTVLC